MDEGLFDTFKKSCVLTMSAKIKTICAVRSCPITTSVSYISDFRWFQTKKFKGLRTGKRGGQATGPFPNPLPGICYTPHSKMCWCTIMQEPHVLVRSGRYVLQQLWEDVL
ncbi:hypothetical protein TNCV_616981 [Trichonephila clavipes]|nr:hypothetical protein TNCV_616981 [Trichonephila clavipes]